MLPNFPQTGDDATNRGANLGAGVPLLQLLPQHPLAVLDGTTLVDVAAVEGSGVDDAHGVVSFLRVIVWIRN